MLSRKQIAFTALFVSSSSVANILQFRPCESSCFLAQSQGKKYEQTELYKLANILICFPTDGARGRGKKGGLPVPRNSPGEQPLCSPPAYSGPVFDSR